MPRGKARLYRDDELRVLWLSARSRELALSDSGIWFRRGRRQRELVWTELEQVQAVVRRGLRRSGQCRVEIFPSAGRAHAVGPFPQPLAEQWLRACAESAAGAGQRVMALEGAPGFALLPITARRR